MHVVHNFHAPLILHCSKATDWEKRARQGSKKSYEVERSDPGLVSVLVVDCADYSYLLEVFAPPPLQGKGHSGECNLKLLHVRLAEGWPARAAEWKGSLGARPRAREKGAGAFRAARASIIPFPFQIPFSSVPFKPLSRAQLSRRVTAQDVVSYCTAKFVNLQPKIPQTCRQRTSTSCGCVKKRKCSLERKIFFFFS